MKHGEVYQANEKRYFLTNHQDYWILIPYDDGQKEIIWRTEAEMKRILEGKKYVLIDSPPEPILPPANNNNFNLTGDEARIFITLMLTPSHKFSGNMLPALMNLIQRLNDISVNQPPTTKES